jgi:hypothetical protein
MAFSPEGLPSLVDRLVSGDYGNCLLAEDRQQDPQRIGLAVCPLAQAPLPPSDGVPVEPEGEGGPVAPPAGQNEVLVVSDDAGEGVYENWTSAYDFADAATQAGYLVTLWPVSLEGEVTLEEISHYGAVIWCTGDYRHSGGTPDQQDLSNLLTYLQGGGRVVLSGAFIGDPQQGEPELLLDVQVALPGHPLAEGFAPDQVIVLERFTAAEDYQTTVFSEADPGAVVFRRGPASESVGRAAIVVEEDSASTSKMAWIGFPIYLLPLEDRALLASNAVRWLFN